jgi:hypothetical protein
MVVNRYQIINGCLYLSSGFIRCGDSSKGSGGAGKQINGRMRHQTELKKNTGTYKLLP